MFTAFELILNSETCPIHDITISLQTTVKVTPVVEGDNSLKRTEIR